MKVLVVGSGGREHAIAWKVKQSPLCSELFCAPGNVGTAELATNVPLGVDQVEEICEWAIKNSIDLTIVGPEAPLADGIVDIFEAKGQRIFGPIKAAAMMESSKSFAKDVMVKAGVATAHGAVFDDANQAREYIQKMGAPIVIKADGLAAGKGVVVAQSLEVALHAIDEFMVSATLGNSGKRVVVEECLIGREASVIALVDGNTDAVRLLTMSSDYKRVFDNDEGPNTGGMGAISPTPVLGDERANELAESVFIPVVRELKKRGIIYRGFLYAGVFVESGTHRVKVIEFNCRLGDPETQVIMMRMESDLLALVNDAVDGKLATANLSWKPGAATTIVMASRGYPGTVDDGKEITGLFPAADDLITFHCGTVADKQDPQKIRSKGGRILTVTAQGEDLHAAVKKAYSGVNKISFDGAQHRTDIGAR